MGAMTRRGVEKALAKLEGAEVANARSMPTIPFDEADWLAWLTQAGKEKPSAREPDFPVALALLKDELAKARASTDPPFDTPWPRDNGSGQVVEDTRTLKARTG